MNYSNCSDETLLFLSRSQNPQAYYALTKRYFDNKEALCKVASPGLYRMFDKWDLNHAFFVAFQNVMKSFRLGHGYFRKYFIQTLRYTMIHEAETLKLFKETPTIINLDETGYSDHGETLHDVIGEDGDNPRMYIDYFEEATKVGKAIKGIDQETLSVARLRIKSLTFQEIADMLGFSVSKCRRLYANYEQSISDIIFGS